MSTPASVGYPTPDPQPAERVSALAPLTIPIFRALWIAALISNVGSWMQTVGAQWFMVEQHSPPLLIALVQTATAAPVLLLGIPAGVLGEFLNRRILLMWVQGFQVAISGTLVALTLSGQMSPYLLLALTLLLGAASAVQLPAYGAIANEIVPRRYVPNAAALSSISVNLARAIGPAVAGLLISGLGVAFVFALNVASFAVFLIILIFWRQYQPEPHLAEPFFDATRAGMRYVANARVVRRLYLRLGLFVLPGSALYALLPLVATERLHLNSIGYGVLLAGLGVGSVAAAFYIPRLRDSLGPNRAVLLSSALFGVGTVGVAVSPTVYATIPILAVVGAAWIGAVATLNGAVQSFLPAWVRTRGLSIYQMVLFGATAAGSAISGSVAGWAGSVTTCLIAGVAVLIVTMTQLAWPLLTTEEMRRSSVQLPLSDDVVNADIGVDLETLVTIRFDVDDADRERFIAQMVLVERSRRRTGARAWALYDDREHPGVIVETFRVGSWQEHLNQHHDRLTEYDDDIIRTACDIARTFEVTHLTRTPLHPNSRGTHLRRQS